MANGARTISAETEGKPLERCLPAASENAGSCRSRLDGGVIAARREEKKKKPGTREQVPSTLCGRSNPNKIDLILHLEGNSAKMKLIDSTQVTGPIHKCIKDGACPRVHALCHPGLLTYSFEGSNAGGWETIRNMLSLLQARNFYR